jgi:NAD-dependent dihydropyrimidine dehydrogenase PreA subunit
VRYVISEACIDALDASCVEACPVDCIYLGARKMYIHPVECIGCGACAPECPKDAIFRADRLPAGQLEHDADNRRFFDEALPGRDAPLGSPGGASAPIGVDTPLVSAFTR